MAVLGKDGVPIRENKIGIPRRSTRAEIPFVNYDSGSGRVDETLREYNELRINRNPTTGVTLTDAIGYTTINLNGTIYAIPLVRILVRKDLTLQWDIL